MSVAVEMDSPKTFVDEDNSPNDKSSLDTTNSDSTKSVEDIVHDGKGKCTPETPQNPMSFTIDFGPGKQVDKQRLEKLAKQSQARHQRVQSMSASLTRPSPIPQKPPLSAKLPRKAQGYNSEGYFSSDQEDSILSGSIKVKQSPQNEKNITSPSFKRQLKSPINDSFQRLNKPSKSPIVDGIMSRSDILPSRQGLNLPLKQSNSSYRDVHRTPSYGNLSSSYQPRHYMADIIDQSPEGIMLTDISSPELDILTTPDNISTPKTPPYTTYRSSHTDIIIKSPKTETLYIDDDDLDRISNNSSTGTYTIEGDNYTEEQKARMSIDRGYQATLKKSMKKSERDPELIFDFANKDIALRSPTKTIFETPKVSKDKNVLEISCCYESESPTENDLAVQTSKQIKSTRSYLEKIKNRVKTITEKTFPKSPPRVPDSDIGNFTSVTTSGVLSTKYPMKQESPRYRRCSLTKSEIDQTDYIHRLSRESSVPVSLPSNKILPFEDNQFGSTVMRNAHAKTLNEAETNSEDMVGKLSNLSLNRCKGDKAWIQDWADSVKKYNNALGEKNDGTFMVTDGELPPQSPRHIVQGKCPLSAATGLPPVTGVSSTPTNPQHFDVVSSTMHETSRPTAHPPKYPALSARSLFVLSRRSADAGYTSPPKQEESIKTLIRCLAFFQTAVPVQDTEAYLQRTQNAISNLQAKLNSSRTSNFTNIPSQLTSSLISEKSALSRLPVSQLSRSNSLNYRLRRKEHDSSPLRSPGHYVITGTLPLATTILINNASKSLDTDKRKELDSNMNSPPTETTLTNVHAITSPYRNAHVRHRSFDARIKDSSQFDTNNFNSQVSLKTVLKNNALDGIFPLRNIEPTRCYSDTRNHQRVASDEKIRRINSPTNVAFGTSMKRSSSYSTVNKNNNYLEQKTPRKLDYKDVDYLTDESDNTSLDKSEDVKLKRSTLHRRIESPDLKSRVPSNSPRCPNTPEMQRKFGPGLMRNSVRPRVMNTRMSEPPVSRDERKVNHQSRRISEPTRQAVFNRLTKSRSSTREFQPKNHEKAPKKPAQYRSSSALATKEVEFSNWKKRSSYDPMKAALEGKKRQQQQANSKRPECNKDDMSSPSHSSPVHRSQSFHSTNIADLRTLDYSSEETEDDQLSVSALPVDHPMITSTHSDTMDLRPKSSEYRELLRRHALNNDVVLSKDYVTSFKVNNKTDKVKRRDVDKRKTFILDDITPTKENVDFLKLKTRDNDPAVDKRKTFILDSDTNSTTNGSSPRNSSIFSHEKSATTGTSDTECESGTESAPVPLRHPHGKPATNHNNRHSGDYSMSSSTTSICREPKKPIQPRYMDISKYKSENSPKIFLRRDPSKTYVGVLNNSDKHKGSAQQYEMEQKKQELEKWKRRASYDPRKAAAQGKNKPSPKTASSVLRSQSFHGPVLSSTSLRATHADYDQSSDNDF